MARSTKLDLTATLVRQAERGGALPSGHLFLSFQLRATRHPQEFWLVC